MIAAFLDRPESAKRGDTNHLAATDESQYDHAEHKPSRLPGKNIAKEPQKLINIGVHFESRFSIAC